MRSGRRRASRQPGRKLRELKPKRATIAERLEGLHHTPSRASPRGLREPQLAALDGFPAHCRGASRVAGTPVFEIYRARCRNPKPSEAEAAGEADSTVAAT